MLLPHFQTTPFDEKTPMSVNWHCRWITLWDVKGIEMRGLTFAICLRVTEHLGGAVSELVADDTTPASVTESHSTFKKNNFGVILIHPFL